MAAQRSDFEFIFASSDKEKDQFTEYHASMGFAAMPFRHDAIEALKSLLQVRGIPTLVTLELAADGDVKLINAKARGQVTSDESGATFPWAKQPSPSLITFEQAQPLFDALDDHPHVAVFDLQMVPPAEVSRVIASLEAAAARQRAAGRTSVQFCKLPAALARAKECCPDGCKLSTQEAKRGMQCDGCRQEVATGSMHSCRVHNFDLCDSCFNAGVNVEPAGRMLFSRIAEGVKSKTHTAAGITVLTNVASNAGFGGFVPLADFKDASIEAAVAVAATLGQ